MGGMNHSIKENFSIEKILKILHLKIVFFKF